MRRACAARSTRDGWSIGAEPARSWGARATRAVTIRRLETPVAAFSKLVGGGQGFLLESVENGERWGRFSFVGRNPVATLTLRDGLLAIDGHPDVDVPLDRGMLVALEALLATYRAPELP